MAAGVIASPQILQLSGIGPARLLSSIGINTIINNSAVGQGLSDHPLIPLYYTVNSNRTWDIVLQDNDVFNADLGQWMASHTGLFVDTPGNMHSFLRIPQNDPIFRVVDDPSSGPHSPHLETIWTVRRDAYIVSSNMLIYVTTERLCTVRWAPRLPRETISQSWLRLSLRHPVRQLITVPQSPQS